MYDWFGFGFNCFVGLFLCCSARFVVGCLGLLCFSFLEFDWLNVDLVWLILVSCCWLFVMLLAGWLNGRLLFEVYYIL